jgi:hypothetical protein
VSESSIDPDAVPGPRHNLAVDGMKVSCGICGNAWSGCNPADRRYLRYESVCPGGKIRPIKRPGGGSCPAKPNTICEQIECQTACRDQTRASLRILDTAG